jgi:hypothetical protein
VTLPPGLLKLATSPAFSGGPLIHERIGTIAGLLFVLLGMSMRPALAPLLPAARAHEHRIRRRGGPGERSEQAGDLGVRIRIPCRHSHFLCRDGRHQHAVAALSSVARVTGRVKTRQWTRQSHCEPLQLPVCHGYPAAWLTCERPGLAPQQEVREDTLCAADVRSREKET